jgi:hypothetical protein
MMLAFPTSLADSFFPLIPTQVNYPIQNSVSKEFSLLHSLFLLTEGKCDRVSFSHFFMCQRLSWHVDYLCHLPSFNKASYCPLGAFTQVKSYGSASLICSCGLKCHL